jgi:hypothetical protein
MLTNASFALTGNDATFDLQLRADSVRSYRSKSPQLIFCFQAAEKSAAFLFFESFFWRTVVNGAERLCLGYLRLNGYLLTNNFCAHHRHETLGARDVIGARFANSFEPPFQDDEKLAIKKG